MGNLFRAIIDGIKQLVQSHVDRVNEINRKYATPRIKMTPAVKAGLLFLRLYLIFIVLILLYKFITILQ